MIHIILLGLLSLHTHINSSLVFYSLYSINILKSFVLYFILAILSAPLFLQNLIILSILGGSFLNSHSSFFSE